MTVPGEVSEGFRAELGEADVAFPGHEGQAIKGHLAQPPGSEPRPGLIVIHEAFGLNDHIRDVCRRFAAVGYTALGPDLYTRADLSAAPDLDEVMRASHSLPDEQVVGDLRGAAEFLAEHPQANGKIGCVGFCAGGRQALLLACSTELLSAAVDCWGGNVLRASPDAETTPARPVPVVELLDRLSCPLMLAVGTEDKNPSPQDAKALAERLEAAGKEFELDVYEGAGHAFFADYRPSYDERSAFRLWERMTDFLARHLQPAPAAQSAP